MPAGVEIVKGSFQIMILKSVVFCYLLVLCLGLVRMYGLRVAMYLYARALL